jgi:hypothetical protein
MAPPWHGARPPNSWPLGRLIQRRVGPHYCYVETVERRQGLQYMGHPVLSQGTLSYVSSTRHSIRVAS